MANYDKLVKQFADGGLNYCQLYQPQQGSS